MSELPGVTGQSPRAYENAIRHCDLILKGGIVSGVVYPSAICALAREYRFRNLGGTSSGAMAAAAAAAAEYGRQRGAGQHFARLADIPAELAARQPDGRSRLFHFFQPAPGVRRLFNVFLASALSGSPWRAFLALLANFWPAALLGAAPGLLLGLLCLAPSPLGLLLGGLIALLLTLLGAILGAAIAALRSLRALHANFYGACTGGAEAGASGPALTEWLATILNELAGGLPPATPLTFGHLWGLHEPAPALPSPELPEERRINLELMTTCLTQGRPIRIAYEHDELSQQFCYRPAELARFFPPEVMDWMRRNPRRPPTPREKRHGMYPLPAMADLPVVVAVRLSLSYPFLLSALPLYGVDYHRASGTLTPKLNLFSDGGICSNFPIHFFDQPLPRWPTFAINLRSPHPNQPLSEDESQNVWMPRRNRDGRVREWQPIAAASPQLALVSFFHQILQTGTSWRDNAYLVAPGYVDRVSHIFLADREGGLNLDMDAPTIARLARRGAAAAQLLLDRYAGPPVEGVELSWDNHRWVRYRGLMEFVQLLLARIGEQYDETHFDPRTYRDLVLRAGRSRPTSYRFSARQRNAAKRGAVRLAMLHAQWRDDAVDFASGGPRPGPELRITPKI
jgi:predicted acylesterase/phospholipase RssA